VRILSQFLYRFWLLLILVNLNYHRMISVSPSLDGHLYEKSIFDHEPRVAQAYRYICNPSITAPRYSVRFLDAPRRLAQRTNTTSLQSWSATKSEILHGRSTHDAI
jgi:hypothetical protein